MLLRHSDKKTTERRYAPDDLEALEETIAILSDPQAMADIEEALQAIAKGDLADMADITMRQDS